MALLIGLGFGLTGCADEPPPQAAGDYPDIADSPTEPPEVASVRERENIAEGLRADRREDRYAKESGERHRSSEVQPPEYEPPSEAPAETTPAARQDAGETASATASSGDSGTESVARTPLAPLPGTDRQVGTQTAAAGPATPVAPLVSPATSTPAASAPVTAQAPAMVPVANPYTSGPIMIDSRGVSTMAPGGTVTTQGPYPVGGPLTAGARPMMPGSPAGGTLATAAGTQPLNAYAPFAGVRSQRVAVIYFADGSSGLSARDRQVLRQVAALQQQYGGLLRIIGHASSRTAATDITTHKMANFTISLKRANAVAEALMEAGTPGRFLYVGAVSDSQPVYYEIMPTGEAGNRRAEIYLDY